MHMVQTTFQSSVQVVFLNSQNYPQNYLLITLHTQKKEEGERPHAILTISSVSFLVSW